MKYLGWITLAVSFILGVVAPAESESIVVRNGVHGEVSVSTAWGDYAVYDRGGGYFWVGTQREFDKASIASIARSSGYRASRVGNDTFVPSETYRTSVGGSPIDNIAPGIMFSVPRVPHRPVIAASNRYVAVSWIGADAALTLIDPRSTAIFRPYSHGSVDENRYAEFSIPRTELTKGMLMIYTMRGQMPGVVGLRSIAEADYRITFQTVSDLRQSGTVPDPQQLEQLQKLLLLYPSLALKRIHKEVTP